MVLLLLSALHKQLDQGKREPFYNSLLSRVHPFHGVQPFFSGFPSSRVRRNPSPLRWTCSHCWGLPAFLKITLNISRKNGGLSEMGFLILKTRVTLLLALFKMCVRNAMDSPTWNKKFFPFKIGHGPLFAGSKLTSARYVHKIRLTKSERERKNLFHKNNFFSTKSIDFCGRFLPFFSTNCWGN